jgi:hypothetical protein
MDGTRLLIDIAVVVAMFVGGIWLLRVVWRSIRRAQLDKPENVARLAGTAAGATARKAKSVKDAFKDGYRS